MHLHGLMFPASKADWNELVDRWNLRIVIGSLLLVLFVTLFPFNFSLENDFPIEDVSSRFASRSGAVDWLVNIALFSPLGFGLAGLLQKRLGESTQLIIVLVMSASFSCGIEMVQLLLPSRYPSLPDICANTAGGVVGFFCFLRWRYDIFYHLLRLMQSARYYLSARKLVVLFFAYLAIITAVTVSSQNITSLSNWSHYFPLTLGNEKSGDRPWHGSVSNITIFNQALSQDEVAAALSNPDLLAAENTGLLAAYQLTQSENQYVDQSGKSPALIWQGPVPGQAPVQNQAVELSDDRWLATEAPATALAQSIRNTSEFTISTVLATSDIAQTGPARIISFSGGLYHRNFTLAQYKEGLIFQLRTPLTGQDGDQPEFFIPHIFSDTEAHHFVITYDGSTLNFYIDRPGNLYTFDLNAGVIFRTYVSPLAGKLYKLLLFSILFIPLGIILGYFFVILKAHATVRVALLSLGIWLPGLVQEGFLANGSFEEIKSDNLLLSTAIVSITVFVVGIISKRAK